MNKLSIISIFLMALITSACASNALAMEGSKPLSDYSAEEVLVYSIPLECDGPVLPEADTVTELANRE